MGRGKHCTPEKRSMILNLKRKNVSNSEISRILICSRKMVVNAINHYDQYKTNANKIRALPPRKTSKRHDSQIRILSHKNPFWTSTEIQEEMKNSNDVEISTSTIRRRLRESGLRGCVALKKPLVSKRNIAKRILFAKEHLAKPMSFWKNVLWTDESKYNRTGSDGKAYVWRPRNQALNPKYTMKTLKHGGGSIMVWGSMSWRGVGPIVRIEGRMDQHVYKDILRNTMEPYTFNNMPVSWTFMHDNDPKHTAKSVKKWLSDENISVMNWSPQSPDLNPIEHLWGDVEIAIRPKNRRI